jgi:GxxExxY protein
MSELLYEEESYAIRGAVFEVYNEMGSGFLEAVYQECLELEFGYQAIPYVAQDELSLTHKKDRLVQTYKPDFRCFGKIIVELKAVKGLVPDHKAQLVNYLKATRLRLGLLVNFGSYPEVEIARMVL